MLGSMIEPKIMVDCFLCEREFQFGPHVYDGEPIPAWGINVCRTCRDSNWDGLVPALHPRLIEHLKAQGIEIDLNEKGWINWPS
jgi:hypothetical protein